MEADFNYQLFNSFNLSFSPELEVRLTRPSMLLKGFLDTKRYILGTIDNKTIRATLRLNYTLNPNLSIQYYAQPFISKGEYTDLSIFKFNYKRLNDGFNLYQSDQLNLEGDTYYFDDDLDGNVDYSMSNPDFSIVQFNSNLVVRGSMFLDLNFF